LAHRFMTIGIYIIIILALGYLSVYIRERYLNVKWMKPLTYIGIFIHELCHAIACYATGGKVVGFNVSSTQGSVEHYQPKVPILGPILVAIAPLLGGLAIVGLLNKVLLINSLEPFQKKQKELLKREVYIREILDQGAERAKIIAGSTMEEVRKKMGLI